MAKDSKKAAKPKKSLKNPLKIGIKAIVQKEDPVLRKIAEPVAAGLFGSVKLKKVIADMQGSLATQDDGVAIAAPQIGISLRIFVVSGKVFDLLHPDTTKTDAGPADKTDTEINDEPQGPDVVFINPEIVKLSKEREIVEEGCLSVRYLYGKIERAKKARIRASDENGNVFEIGGTGLLAQIFQHETDHLDGKLFIDRATDLHDLPPEVQKNNA